MEKNMRVLLISANTEKINILPAPLGLNYVAAAAQESDHDVRLLDLMSHADILAPVRQAVESFRPEIIGISVRNIDDQVMQAARFLLDEVRGLVRECRNLSGAPIVLGGAGYSIFPQAVLDYLEADMGIQGEGEAAFPELLARLAKGEDPAGLPGLYLRGRGLQGERAFIRDLGCLPVSGVHHFLTAYDRNLWMPFQTRRGCPMNCSYCSTAVIEGRTLRKRPPEQVVRELKTLAQAGFRQFYFVDNTFNLPPSYAKEICRLIIREGLDIQWRCIFYPGTVDEELIRLMAEAGCCEVSLGFESGSARILKALNKRFSPEEVRRTSQMLARHGIRQMGFLLLGGPGETRESVMESLRFADSLSLESGKVSRGIRIYPGTALAKIAAGEGKIARDDALLRPAFYMVREIEEWLAGEVAAWIADRPHWMG